MKSTLVIPDLFESSSLYSNKNFASYYNRLPVNEVETVQLSKGEFDLRTFEAFGSSCIYIYSMSDPLISSIMFAGPEWMLFMWPASWRGEFKVNGKQAEPANVYLMDGAIEWATVGAQRKLVMLGIKRDVMLQIWASLTGVEGIELARGNRIYKANTESRLFLQKLQRTVFLLSGSVPLVDGKLLMPQAFEEELVSAVVSWLIAHDAPQYKETLDHSNSLSVVNKTRELVQINNHRFISLAEVCASACIGRTKLHNSFVDIYGTSAAHYLKMQRLTCAREMLSQSINPAISVKYAALTCGFPTSSRFAREYNAMFGELPSVTLRKALKAKG